MKIIDIKSNNSVHGGAIVMDNSVMQVCTNGVNESCITTIETNYQQVVSGYLPADIAVENITASGCYESYLAYYQNIQNGLVRTNPL